MSWQLVIGTSGAPAAADVAKMKATFAMLQINIASIIDRDEKERWTANAVLWKAMIDRM